MNADHMDWWESAREANEELKRLRDKRVRGIAARLSRWWRIRGLEAHIRFCNPPKGWLD